MPDLIQVADDLKQMPDQWLAQQMQSPSGTAPPWLVASEVARREKMRSGAAQAKAPASSVTQDLIKSLYARIPPTAGLMPQQQPPGAVPPGMPPVNLTPGGGTFGGPSPGGPAPGTPPANFRMPARPMAEGGEYDEDDNDNEETDDGGDTAPATAPVYRQPSRRNVLRSLSMPRPAQTPGPSAAPVTPFAASGISGPGLADQKGLIRFARKQGTIDGLVDKMSERYGVRRELIQSVIRQESGGNPRAVSRAGALGLMQLMPATAKMLGVKNPLHPEQNIEGGTKYLSQLLDQFKGDETLALAAYNAGPGNVRKYNGVPPFKETQNYVRNIIGNLPEMPVMSPQGSASRQEEETPATDVNEKLTTPQTQLESYDAQGKATSADTAAEGNAPAPPKPLVITAPTMERPAELKELDTEYKRASEELAASMAKVTPYDPETSNTKEAIQGYKDRIKAFIGGEPDNSRMQQAFEGMSKMAQELMHPSLSSMLIQFGANLMASPAHNFGQAVGQAGAATLAARERQQQQGRGLWVQAMNMGVRLQEHQNAYQEKLGELAYQQQRLDQSQGTAQYKGQLELVKEQRLQLQEIARERSKQQTELDKTFATSPAGRLMQINQVRTSTGQPPLDTSNASKAEMEYYQFGKKPTGSGTANKPPTREDQYLQTAVEQTAKAHDIKLPTDRKPTLADLPSEFQQEAINLNSDFGAGRAIATEKGKADLVSPEAIESMGLRLLNGETIGSTGRNSIVLSRAHEWALNKAKEMGMTGMEMMLQQGLVKANKGALIQLTKNIETVEPFITLADRNANKLNELAAKIPDAGRPAFNVTLRNLEKQWKGNPALSAFYAQLVTTRTELARVIGSASAGGVLHESQLEEMKKALGDDGTPAMIMAAVTTLQDESHARRDIYRAQQKDLASRTVVGSAEKKPAAEDDQTTPKTPTAPPRPTTIPADAEAQYSPRLKQWRYRPKGAKEWQTLSSQ